MSADELDLLSEDYSVVDHRLQLFLDMEVFEEEEEELHSFLKVWKREAGPQACEKGSCCCSQVWVAGGSSSVELQDTAVSLPPFPVFACQFCFRRSFPAAKQNPDSFTFLDL